MKKITLLIFIVFFAQLTLSQTVLRGVVVESGSRYPIPFATVVYYESGSSDQKGVMTDAFGNFEIKNTHIHQIRVSCIGYNTETIKINSSDYKKKLVVSLSDNPIELNQLVVTAKNNPALRIIRNALDNKSKNDFKRYPEYSYITYVKTLIDVKTSEDSTYIEKDGLELRSDSILNSQVPFINETVVKNSKVNRQTQSIIIAQKTSGFKDPLISQMFSSVFHQAISFYENNVSLFATPDEQNNFNTSFVSPLSDGCLRRYSYELENKLITAEDTIFIINYKPKKGSTFSGLKGTMLISSNGYALKNIMAQPADDLLISFKFRQDYEIVHGKWFPTLLEEDILFNGLKLDNSNKIPAYVVSVKNDSISYHVTDKKLGRESIEIDYKMLKNSEEIIAALRKDSLTQREERSYHFMDSVNNELDLDRFLRLMPKLAKGFIPYKIFDFDISKIFNTNLHENVRLGVGVQTNERLLRKLSVGGYFGYGFRDKSWKYGGNLIATLDKVGDTHITLSVRKDLYEIGSKPFTNNGPALYNQYLRSLVGEKYDEISQKSLTFESQLFRHLNLKTQLALNNFKPTYEYLFNGTELNEYCADAVSVSLEYAFGKKMSSFADQRLVLAPGNPILTATYTRGINNINKASYLYNKIEGSLNYTMYDGRIGKTSLFLSGGYIDRNLPVALMFTGEGSRSNDVTFVVDNYFQTMHPYEFLSDRYVHLFFKHNFGTLLLKTKNFKPQFVVHHNIGWGDMQHPEVYSLQFRTMDKIYLESGLSIQSLLRSEFMDMLYMSVGVGAFYRYGHYSNDSFKDNIAAKVSFTFDW